jgi:hypothetical protein
LVDGSGDRFEHLGGVASGATVQVRYETQRVVVASEERARGFE